MVIWITGISGSGKSTICGALGDILKPVMPELVILDGDVIREAFGNDLGYREQDRVVQIKRLQGLARALSNQGLTVFVAALYAHPDLLSWNRENIPSYFELYLDAPLSLVEQRDPKGLYAKARSGDMPNVVGLDIPWHAPEAADMVIDMTGGEDPGAHARHIIAAVPALAARARVIHSG